MKGMSTFFTYMSPDGLMDTGYTEHSGCPVKEGQKWIATAWMREGVTKKHSADYFEPSGKRNNMVMNDDDDEEEQNILDQIYEVEQGVVF